MPTCSVCVEDVTFVSINGLYQHLQMFHPSELSGVLKCRTAGCLTLFSSWKALRKHFIRSHNFPAHATTVPKRRSTKVSQEVTQEQADSDSILRPVDESVNENAEQVSTEGFGQSLLSNASHFLTKFYSNPRLPRNHIQEIVNHVGTFLRDIVAYLTPSLLSIVSDTETDVCSKEDQVRTLLEVIVHPFENTLSTEYKRFKFLRASGNFIEADDYIVGHRLDDKYSCGQMHKKRVSVKGKYVPIDKILEKFLSLPGVFKTVMDYVEYCEKELECGIVSNFIQCELWKRKTASFVGKIVLPLFLYFDDFEVGNPLGPHAGLYKLGAVYFTLACLPPEFRSRVENVFLTLLFHASDRAVPEDGNYYVFQQFIDDLNLLGSKGVTIEVDGNKIVVYFLVGVLLADNLGYHQALGFAGGFNANFYCRFCKTPKKDLEHMFEECRSSLRQRATYEHDVEMGLSMAGVTENSVWNSLSNFHVYENFSVDVLHDILLGVCKTDFALILKHYVCEKKSLPIEVLNSRINSFNYTINGLENRPPCLSTADIAEGKISMTGSEMYNFVLLFAFFVADILKANSTDPYWALYLSLRGIVEIVFAKSFQKECIETLKLLVSEHHRIRVILLKSFLKPKDHFLVHYITAIFFSGPSAHLSTATFESKHRELKTIANSSSSRVFICHTIALKEQLSFCFRLESKKGLDIQFEAGPSEHIDSSHIDGSYLYSECLPDEFRGLCSVVPWAEYQGIRYHRECFVVIDSDNLFPTFAQVERIFLSAKFYFCVVLRVYETTCFDENMHAYSVRKSSSFSCKYIHELSYPFLVIHHNGSIALRQML